MGIELSATTCTKCGKGVISGNVGPNWMHIPAPAPRDWAVVMLLCPNAACKEPMGTYAYPVKTQ